jgi:DNA-binding PadR family transcriptional regulator
MAVPKGDLTASMAILGLLVSRPDTASGLQRRLAREYPHGRWSRSIAYGDVQNLVKRGLIRKVKRGEQESEHVYEASPSGLAALKAELRAAASTLAPMREALHLWLEHSSEADMPEILNVIEELEEAARAEYAEASARLTRERAIGRLGPPDGSNWQGRMRDAVLSHAALHYGQEARGFRILREKILNHHRERHERLPDDG